MKTNKYDLEQVERDYKYYKSRDDSNDEGIYFMLMNRYENRARIARERFQIAIRETNKIIEQGDEK